MKCVQVLAHVTLPWALEWFPIPTLQRAPEPGREVAATQSQRPGQTGFFSLQCVLRAWPRSGGADTAPSSCYWSAAARPAAAVLLQRLPP